jgi:hypothetical protein
MQPQLNVWIDGSTEPRTVLIQSVGLWIYDELRERAHLPSSEHGLRLTLAYLELEDKEPETLAEIKQWAKAHKVSVMLAEPPDPTP